MPGKTLESVLGDSYPLRETERAATWIRHQVAIHDDESPLLVDVVGDEDQPPRKLIFLFPGGGLNFAANYFTPNDRNLTHFLRAQGGWVVGIAPRDGGMARLKRDAHQVISLFTERLDLPYDLVGHSAGGALALDYAATQPDGLDRLMVIDTTGAYAEPDLRRRAAESLAGVQDLLDRGQTTMPIGLGALIEQAVHDPSGASAVPWPPDRARRFTNAGAAHFALVNTGSLPGLTNWIYHGGLTAGRYTFGASPAEDAFELTHSPLAVLHEQARKLDTEAASTELIRDLLAIWAGDESVYRIDWANIRASVSWVNAALGRGDHPHGAELIRQAGNESVRFTVVPGYGHGDPVWSTTAAEDYWTLLTDR